MTDEQLAKELMRSGVVDLAQIQEAARMRRAGKSLRDVLLEQGIVSKADLQEIAPESDAPSGPVDLRSYPIDMSAVSMITREQAVELAVLPVAIENQTVVVAMANPNDLPRIDRLSALLGRKVKPIASTEAQIMEAVNRCYTSSALSEATELSRTAEHDEVVMENVEELLDQAPTIRIVNMIIAEAVKQKASDIHVEPREDGLYLRFRVDGLLRPPSRLEKAMESSIISRIKVMCELDLAEQRLPQDGRFRHKIAGRVIDFRVSTLPTYHGEKVVLRLLDKTALKTNLNELGFDPETGRLFEELVLKPQGMILVTGPTGSGKSTTLYAALHRTKSETKNVVTVEDPIEYQLEGINQSQVDTQVGLTFAAQLRAILRQDPDVILVGEIRDAETAEMAFRGALTGHLVLSTLHTNDATSAPTRLVDMGAEPFIIGASLIGVLAQKLVRTICQHCKQQYEPETVEVERIGLSKERAAGMKFFHGVGCPACGHTGFSGRLACYELLTISDPVRDALNAGANSSELRRVALREGLRTLRDDGISKVAAGLTTPDELSRVLFSFMDEQMLQDEVEISSEQENGG